MVHRVVLQRRGDVAERLHYIAFQGFDFGVASATAVFNVLLLAVPAAVYLWVMARVRRAGRGREPVTA